MNSIVYDVWLKRHQTMFNISYKNINGELRDAIVRTFSIDKNLNSMDNICNSIDLEFVAYE